MIGRLATGAGKGLRVAATDMVPPRIGRAAAGLGRRASGSPKRQRRNGRWCVRACSDYRPSRETPLLSGITSMHEVEPACVRSDFFGPRPRLGLIRKNGEVARYPLPGLSLRHQHEIRVLGDSRLPSALLLAHANLNARGWRHCTQGPTTFCNGEP